MVAGSETRGPPPLVPIPVPRNTKKELAEHAGALVMSLDRNSAVLLAVVILSMEHVLPARLRQKPTPREIGAVQLTLRAGMLAKYHRFVDPGPLPRGYMHEALFH